MGRTNAAVALKCHSRFWTVHFRGMRWTTIAIFFLCAPCALAQLPNDVKSDLGPDVPAFKVRPGYRVTRALPAKKLRNVRFIQFSADGKTLFVSSREDGEIYALSEPDSDGVFQKVATFVKNRRSVQ